MLLLRISSGTRVPGRMCQCSARQIRLKPRFSTLRSRRPTSIDLRDRNYDPMLLTASRRRQWVDARPTRSDFQLRLLAVSKMCDSRSKMIIITHLSNLDEPPTLVLFDIEIEPLRLDLQHASSQLLLSRSSGCKKVLQYHH